MRKPKKEKRIRKRETRKKISANTGKEISVSKFPRTPGFHVSEFVAYSNTDIY